MTFHSYGGPVPHTYTIPMWSLIPSIKSLSWISALFTLVQSVPKEPSDKELIMNCKETDIAIQNHVNGHLKCTLCCIMDDNYSLVSMYRERERKRKR